MKWKLIIAARIKRIPYPVKEGKGTPCREYQRLKSKKKMNPPHALEVAVSGNGSKPHRPAVLSLERSPLAPRGGMGINFPWIKTLSFRTDTSQLPNLAMLGKERVQKGPKPRAHAVYSRWIAVSVIYHVGKSICACNTCTDVRVSKRGRKEGQRSETPSSA